MPLKRNIFIYYVANFLAVSAQALPHAILTPLLLAKGLSLAQIMWVQAIYSMAVLLAEYPSGVLADLMRRKFLFIGSKLVLLLSFSLVWLCEGFFWMLVAWGLYGLASALDSGTIDASLTNAIKTQKANLSKFIATGRQLSFLGMVVGSVLGSFLYVRYGASMYVVALLLLGLCIAVVGLGFIEREGLAHSKSLALLKRHVQEGFMELRHKPQLKNLMICSLVLQVFFQTHFQLWQAYFLAQNIDSAHLFYFYVGFQILGVLVHFIPVHTAQGQKLWWLLGLLPVLIGLLSPLPLVYILLYAVVVGVFTWVGYYVDYHFSLGVSAEKISSLISLKSSVSRLASVGVLALSSVELALMPVGYVVVGHFAIALLGVVWGLRFVQEP
ncbi:MFS transporter [Helicobacter vulpis]|uniref:MFS transporter n=1 Tax=Helicobacter vulpis TaxID=2316076 RepID=UPI000EB31704|nr:MFS transporter [Helicobacter vulpis]